MSNPQPQDLEEITVRRINVVNDDGTVQLVISSKERAPDWEIDGATFERPKAAGMIFYNEEGCECGGLQFSGMKGQSIEARGGLTFDRYQNDQVIGITYGEEAGKLSYGLKMWDRPTGLTDAKHLHSAMSLPDGAEKEAVMKDIETGMREGVYGLQRFFAGRAPDGSLQVMMADSKGRPRIRMVVDADDNPRIEFLDAAGTVTHRLPPD